MSLCICMPWKMKILSMCISWEITNVIVYMYAMEDENIEYVHIIGDNKCHCVYVCHGR